MLVGALVLLCYLIGLTYVAKQENLSELREPLAARSSWARRSSTRAPRSSRPGALAAVLYVGFLAWVVLRGGSLLVRRGRRDIRARS